MEAYEIDTDTLYRYGAVEKKLNKKEHVFLEEESPRFYNLILDGEVQMYNVYEDGHIFIQEIFSKGRSFGGPPLIGNFPYPASAMALEDTVLLQLKRDSFIQLLLENPEIHLAYTRAMAEIIHYKALMAVEMSSNHNPEQRILKLLTYLKEDINELSEPFSFIVDLTRQQIADLVGLRVETVIKAIKRLEQKGALKIIDRKVYY